MVHEAMPCKDDVIQQVAVKYRNHNENTDRFRKCAGSKRICNDSTIWEVEFESSAGEDFIDWQYERKNWKYK